MDVILKFNQIFGLLPLIFFYQPPANFRSIQQSRLFSIFRALNEINCLDILTSFSQLNWTNPLEVDSISQWCFLVGNAWGRCKVKSTVMSLKSNCASFRSALVVDLEENETRSELSLFSPCINVNVCQYVILYTLLEKFLEHIFMSGSLVKTFLTISNCLNWVQATLKIEL